MKAIRFFALLLAVVAIFISCDDKVNPPVISDVEIGRDNSKKANAGGDLHIDANIIAEAKIAKIILTIHSEEERQHAAPAMKVGSALTHEWEVDSTYTGKYSGVKNTNFHEDIKVPDHAATGHYHLQLTVIDMEGNSAKFEEEIEILASQPGGSAHIAARSSAVK